MITIIKDDNFLLAFWRSPSLISYRDFFIGNQYTLFYKNKPYKNTMAEIGPKIKNKLRTATRLKF